MKISTHKVLMKEGIRGIGEISGICFKYKIETSHTDCFYSTSYSPYTLYFPNTLYKIFNPSNMS